jgi:glutaredoxin-like protein
MTYLQDKDLTVIRTRFEELVHPVRLINFTQEVECLYCAETSDLMGEVAGLSDLISVEVRDFVADTEDVKKYSIDKIPATIVEGDTDYGIRFFGIPTGYEFGTLIEDIIMVSKRDSGLDPDTRRALAALNEPIHLQVFVTPTCPYCPAAVQLAHRFAMECDGIVADMVETTEFPHLTQRYGVVGVPKTVANEIGIAEGVVPENVLTANLTAMSAILRTPGGRPQEGGIA